ncbi:MAG TPA: class I SAM-dependent methyltransferase [Gemmatimonadaceae bacterium]|nr:class I SAM-dependent methyltransferase [Gemmatimonadaceae bacterium]
MDTAEAVALIRDAVGQGVDVGSWADLGAGTGTFTQALHELLPAGSRIYAIDRDAAAIARVKHWASEHAPDVVARVADFTKPTDIRGLSLPSLDGMLLANSLHFVRDATAVLARLVNLVRPGGRVVLVEYDRRGASRWVPYPIPIAALPSLASQTGLAQPSVVATRPSEYQGILYVALARKPGTSQL